MAGNRGWRRLLPALFFAVQAYPHPCLALALALAWPGLAWYSLAISSLCVQEVGHWSASSRSCSCTGEPQPMTSSSCTRAQLAQHNTAQLADPDCQP